MSKPLNLRRSAHQERDTARKFGGYKTPGSGNGVWVKNDVRTREKSIECKVTEKASYSLKREDLEKAEFNANADNRDMIFKITFLGTARPKSYVILPEEDYIAEVWDKDDEK